ncbi:hypothetical protein VC279_15625 [Xanthomonas sp. WHRI 10064A]|uniref:hypothetical protein n=1 Tax=unclassified Xanthomonas TaxID=2643310 RepID=UPI002B23AF4D|nr:MULTISPECIES: hypothetical protein [unclassified Xanthomonas]MEA9586893.1 hypothetical protein [Xanthomonas sp. WHRI 10064B]MEA9616084.1 hypothetical protein [Xanthomonas sp. WHRI 10064A]
MSEEVPYIKPFGGPTNNRNVAGSYAPSSLRGVAPLMKVISFDQGSNPITLSLKTQHSSLAFKHLLNDQRISLVALGVFLYRDFLIDPSVASSAGIRRLVKVDFGLSQTEIAEAYSARFTFGGELFE